MDNRIKEILANTTVDTVNNKVSVKYLDDKEKLQNLGENFYGATKRALALHFKIFPKLMLLPEWTNTFMNKWRMEIM